MRQHPPLPPVLPEERLLPQVVNDGPPSLVDGVVGPDEVGSGQGEVAEGADAAAAHGVEEAERRWRAAERTPRSRPGALFGRKKESPASNSMPLSV